MASLKSFHGWSFRVYDFNSPDAQISILDASNLVILVLFYLLLLLCYLRKENTTGPVRKRDSISVSVSSCCFLTLIAYLVAGLLEFGRMNWWVYIVRSLIWASLTVSSFIERFKYVKILVSIWWVFFFGSISFVNIENLAEKRSIVILVLLEWAASFLLLVCALRNLKHFLTRNSPNQTLTEPLLGNTSQLQEPSFLSKSTFSWVNPLLALGYRKPLDLQDIPSLESQDQSAVAHEKFSKVWDSLQTEKKYLK